jgi:AcrR family transcriptional regulator
MPRRGFSGLVMTATPTKQRLLELGLGLLLKHGYADLGVATLLERAGVPKGSFYHHFASKEDFGLQAIDFYMEGVHGALRTAFADDEAEPFDQIRRFPTATKVMATWAVYWGAWGRSCRESVRLSGGRSRRASGSSRGRSNPRFSARQARASSARAWSRVNLPTCS